MNVTNALGILAFRYALVLFLTGHAVTAHAAATLPLPLPNLDLRSSGQVYCIAQQADGKVLVGGSFSEADNSTVRNLVRFNPDGSVDAGWTPATPLPVEALSVSADGYAYVLMWTATGSEILKIALAGNGSADSGFSNFASRGWAQAMVADDNGHLYIATSYNGPVARYDAATGALDASWHTDVTGNSLAFDHAGHLYIGATRVMLADGSRDSAWNPPPTSNTANTVALGNDGYLYIGGFGQFGTTGVANLARLAAGAGGAVDSSWTPAPQNDSTGVQINALLPQADGSVIVGGYFDRIGNGAHANLARLTGAQGQADPQWAGAADGIVNVLAGTASGVVYAGGAYAVIGTGPGAAVARLSADGRRDSGFGAGVYGGATVAAIARDPSTGLTYVGGAFDWAGSQVHHNILRLAADGSLDSSWTAGTDVVQGPPSSALGGVQAIAIAASGDIYLGGAFSRVDQAVRHDLAKVSWAAPGAVDLQWHPEPTGSFSNVTNTTHIDALVTDNSGGIFVGGDFKSIGGIAQEMIAHVNASGAVDPAWRPDPYYPIDRLAFDQRDNLYFVFDNINTGGAEAGKVSASTGTFDFAWDQATHNYGYVDDVATLGTDWVLLAYRTGLHATSANPVIRVAASTGAADPGWMPAIDCTINRLAVDATASFVYAAGVRDATSGSQPCAYRIMGNATLDATFAPVWPAAAYDGIWALAVGNSDGVIVGGGFNAVSSVTRSSLAGFTGPDHIFQNGFER